MFRGGSDGPGMRLTKMTFSCLYRLERGRFITVKYKAPSEYTACLNGLNQSTFVIGSEKRYIFRKMMKIELLRGALTIDQTISAVGHNLT